MLDGRSRWLVVMGSTIALVVSSGPIILFTFSVFLKPVADANGWSRGTMSLGLSLGLTLAGLATPIAGRMVDRWGIRRVTLALITLFAASFAAISLTPNNVGIFIAAYGAAGLFASGQAPLPYAKAISGWFETQRGLALGIAMAGVGVGIALMPQVVGALLRHLDWREAYAATGLVVWLVAFPAVLLFVRDPPTAERTTKADIEGDSVSVALKGRAFWRMTAASFLVVTVINGVIAHLVALLTDVGVPREVAVSTLVVVGLAAIAGRLVSGFLLDRFFAPYLAATIFLVPLVAMIILLAGVTTLPLVMLVAICLGFGLGAEIDVIGFLVGRYFGLKRYGELYGYIFAVFSIGSGVGPYLLGLTFDRTGNYKLAVLGSCALLVIASGLVATLGAYRYPASDRSHAPASKRDALALETSPRAS